MPLVGLGPSRRCGPARPSEAKGVGAGPRRPEERHRRASLSPAPRGGRCVSGRALIPRGEPRMPGGAGTGRGGVEAPAARRCVGSLGAPAASFVLARWRRWRIRRFPGGGAAGASAGGLVLGCRGYSAVFALEARTSGPWRHRAHLFFRGSSILSGCGHCDVWSGGESGSWGDILRDLPQEEAFAGSVFNGCSEKRVSSGES